MLLHAHDLTHILSPSSLIYIYIYEQRRVCLAVGARLLDPRYRASYLCGS